MMLSTWAFSTRAFAGFVLAASAVVLGAALSSQYWGGLVPCELCVLQRWPWAVAITISIVALFVAHDPSLRWVALVLGLVFLVGIGFAFYHLGVEQHWFAGPSACTPSTAAPTTLEEMRQRILNAPGRALRCCAVVVLRRVAGRMEPAGLARDGCDLRRRVLVRAAGAPDRTGAPGYRVNSPAG